MTNLHSKMTPELLFMNMILDLSSTAMFAMGKIAHPETGKTEKNLEMAQMSIDMLEMLQTKTKGNLNDKEEALLSTTLTNLRLTFVRESQV